MNQQRTAQLGYWLKVVTLGVVLGFGIQFAQAWTNPGAAAPGGNVAGPINTGAGTQVKSGSLGLTGNLAVGGSVKVGQTAAACSAALSGAMRYNATTKGMEYCDTTAWKSLTAVATAPVTTNAPCGTHPHGSSWSSWDAGCGGNFTTGRSCSHTCINGTTVTSCDPCPPGAQP